MYHRYDIPKVQVYFFLLCATNLRSMEANEFEKLYSLFIMMESVSMIQILDVIIELLNKINFFQQFTSSIQPGLTRP